MNVMINSSLHELEEQYFTLRANIDKILGQCTTDLQKQEVFAAYLQSRLNYFRGINCIFDQGNDQVKKLTNDLKAAKTEIDQQLADLRNIVKVLNVITAAVNIGTKLVALVA